MNHSRKLSPDDTRQRIRDLGPWFQNLKLDGIETAPDHFLGDYPRFKWEGFKHVLPDDLEGASVLDVGCNAGFYSIEMKRRNAGRVLGIDTDRRYLDQAEFSAERAGFDIEFRQMSVYEAADLGEKFDLVLFMGVLYHLRYPLLALDLLREHVVGGKLLFQCLQRGDERVPDLKANYDFSEWGVFDRADYPKLFFIEQSYASDPTNWFIPNRAAAEALLRSAGFAVEAHPEREVYLCRRAEWHHAGELPKRLT